jgi:undecaprenyl-diphosphatase
VNRWIVVTLSFLITVLLPMTFGPGGGASSVDASIGRWVHRTFDEHPGLYGVLITPSDTSVVISVLALAVLFLWWRGHRADAVFLALAPEFAVGVNEVVLKHLWHRHLHDHLAYPSGHTFQYAAVATGLVLVAKSTPVRVVVVSLAVVLLPAIAIAMVGRDYHYPTDILGGLCAGVCSVVLLDGLRRRIARDQSRRIAS